MFNRNTKNKHAQSITVPYREEIRDSLAYLKFIFRPLNPSAPGDGRISCTLNAQSLHLGGAAFFLSSIKLCI